MLRKLFLLAVYLFLLNSPHTNKQMMMSVFSVSVKLFSMREMYFQTCVKTRTSNNPARFFAIQSKSHDGPLLGLEYLIRTRISYQRASIDPKMDDP